LGVGELEVGDLLTDARGRSRRITSIERVDGTARTYTFQVKGGNYIAGGFVVHNKEICQKFMALPNYGN
jgi:intein/homing endonuclease